ncbi:MAG TPA: uracil-DNA glycosylase family protein [Alphaproteobacteria bacterium]|nr:uracil-DNA glycosylase family protein [Alphaproteobacteria bacterium]
MSSEAALERLLKQIRACNHCGDALPLGPNPTVRANRNAKILIIGQAPGTKVHKTSIPWNDASGDNLRNWLGLTRDEFYDENNIAIVPMGFCYPGRGKSGDNPPRPECAPKWHAKLHAQMPNIKLTLLIGQYALAYYLGDTRKKTLTDTVKAWKEYMPKGFMPLVHPSPRNRLWMRRNPWFEKKIVPELRRVVANALFV